MTLQNLLKIGRLKAHEPNAAEVQRLLAAIKRNLADAAAANISDETRFDAAYKAVMQGAHNLPPPEVIAQEIVEDLEAALEQFRLIAGDLNGGGAATT